MHDLNNAKQTVDALNSELEGRIAARTSDLANANDHLMREIADRECIQSKVVQSKKLEAIGRLTGSIAHDFNNLLYAVNLNLQFIARMSTEKRVADYARCAKESVERGARLTAQLLSFARAKPAAAPARRERNGAQPARVDRGIYWLKGAVAAGSVR